MLWGIFQGVCLSDFIGALFRPYPFPGKGRDIRPGNQPACASGRLPWLLVTNGKDISRPEPVKCGITGEQISHNYS